MSEGKDEMYEGIGCMAILIGIAAIIAALSLVK